MSNAQQYCVTTPQGFLVCFDDDICITGYSTSCKRKLMSFVCMIGHVAPGGSSIKVWPDSCAASYAQLTEEEKLDGKIWFDVNAIEACHIISKGFVHEIL